MPKVAGGIIATTGTGGSDYFNLDQGRHLLTIKWAGSPGETTIEVSDDGGISWFPVRDSAGIITVTSNYSLIVFGLLAYRLNVTTHTSIATFKATDLDNKKLD